MDAAEDHTRDCAARWLLAHPERGRAVWRHWADPEHRARKPQAFLDDMRRRIDAQRARAAA